MYHWARTEIVLVFFTVTQPRRRSGHRRGAGAKRSQGAPQRARRRATQPAQALIEAQPDRKRREPQRRRAGRATSARRREGRDSAGKTPPPRQTAAAEGRSPRQGTRPKARTECRRQGAEGAQPPTDAERRRRAAAQRGRDAGPLRAQRRRKPPKRRASTGRGSAEAREAAPAAGRSGSARRGPHMRTEARPTEERMRRNSPGTPERERTLHGEGREQPRPARGKALIAPSASAQRAAGPDEAPLPPIKIDFRSGREAAKGVGGAR